MGGLRDVGSGLEVVDFRGAIFKICCDPKSAGTMRSVTASELRRYLKSQGCTFEEGTRHSKARLGGRFAPIPRHPSQEIPKGTLKAILKQLGLAEPGSQAKGTTRD
jgi:mRNA interferase HicA